jgi:hypothetical protein
MEGALGSTFHGLRVFEHHHCIAWILIHQFCRDVEMPSSQCNGISQASFSDFIMAAQRIGSSYQLLLLAIEYQDRLRVQ